MKKLFTHLLAVAAAILIGSASVSAQETFAIDFGNVSPAPYTLFVKGSANEYLHEVDIMFPGAQQITVNPDITPMLSPVGVSTTNALKVTAHATYTGNAPTVATIDGGVRVTVYGKGNYGSTEKGLSYMVTTSTPVLKLPAGLLTVKGADGVERSNEDAYLRYFWENFEAIHPIGITPGCKVSSAQLSTLTFPDDVTIGATPTDYNGSKLKLLKVIPGEKPEEIASFTLSQEDGAPLVGKIDRDIASVAPGEYFITYTGSKVFKKNGAEQKGAYMFPVNIVGATATEMSVKIADGFSATGKNVPEFALSVAGTPVFAAGAVTATIGEDVYNLTVSGQNLAFSAADAKAIKDKYANKGDFTIAIAAAAGAVQVSGEEYYSNSNAISATFTVKIDDMMDFSQYTGMYYMKYLIGQSQDGDPVEIRGLKSAMLVDYSEEEMGYILTGFADPTPETQNGLMFGVPNAANHSIDFPACQMLYFSDAPRAGLSADDIAQVALIAKDEDAMVYDPVAATKIPAHISDDATINFEGWKIVSIKEDGEALKADYTYVNDGKAFFIPLSETKPAAASDFKVEFTSGASGLVIAASAVLPDKDVTGFEVYAGEELVYKNYRVSGGEHLDFVLDFVPEKGSVNTFTAKVYNCVTESDPVSVVLTFDPIDINNVIGDYKTEAFSGKMTPFTVQGKKVNVLVDETNFNYVDMKMKVALNGDARGVEYPIIITGFGDFEMQATFNALTGRFTFKQDGAYSLSFTYTDPETGSETNASQSMNMIAYNNSGDIVKNTPAIADYANDKITFGGGITPAWCLVYPDELYNNTSISCTEMVLVKDVKTYTPASPVLTVTDAPADGVHHVSGTVTMPTVDAEGNPLPADLEMSVYVYRNLPAGPMEPLMDKVVAMENGPEFEGFVLVYAGEKAAPGEVVKFTDPATDLNEQMEFFYVATVAHKDSYCEEPDMKALDAYSAIRDIFTDADSTHNVYNTQGILLIRDADADAVRSLNSGIYIVAGRKIFVK